MSQDNLVQAPFDLTIRLEPLLPDRQTEHCHGHLFLTLPGQPDQAQPLFERILPCILEHIRFFYSDFDLLGGGICAKRIPETEEERQLIGDRPYDIRVTMREVPDPVPFNPDVIRLFPHTPEVGPLIDQFNSARAARSPIDRYLGMFKVLELQFHTGWDPKKSLRNRKDFISLAYRVVQIKKDGRNKPIQQNEVPGLIDDLVKTRDQCAHLQRQFGYGPHDREVYEWVEPLAGLVEKLALESILHHFRAKAPDRLDSVLASLGPKKSPAKTAVPE